MSLGFWRNLTVDRIRIAAGGGGEFQRPDLSVRTSISLVAPHLDNYSSRTDFVGVRRSAASAVAWSFPGCVPDCGEEERGVAVVESRDGVAQVDGDAVGEAGGQQEDAPFAAGAWEFACLQGGDGGFPVDGGHRGGAVADAGAVLDEPVGEVVAPKEGAVAGEQGDAGFEGVEPYGARAEGGCEVVSGHGGLLQIGSPLRCRGRRGCRG